MQILEALKAIFTQEFIVPLGIGFSASFLSALLLVLTKTWHGSLSLDSTYGIQKFHVTPTPRIGGVPIVLALLLVLVNCSPEIKELLAPILLAGIPAFWFGIVEDLTKQVGVIQRLLATMASGLVAWWITDYSLSRLDIWGIDFMMQFTIISVLVTSFSIAGVANAINIIDGFNGLSTFTCTVAFTGLALIAYQVGDHNLALVALIFGVCVWGFFWINWPLGKMFLGDGGSYFVGFALSWVSVILIERNSSVSAFSALLICILPITEVLLSIYRRRVRKQQVGKADRMHFHSILYRRYINRWLSKWPLWAKNSVVGILVGSLNCFPVLLSIFCFKSTILCLTFIVLFVYGYVAVYFRMIRYKWNT
jgi:UDP-N-acetylmuramyl pentapeptide phosphotransferase/UDP-N-acetylglucosamine-1-phosphate transferase